MASPCEDRPGLFASIGVKLAAATILLVALIALGSYVALSRYEHRNLFAAKEEAASMVVRLFNASLAASIELGEDGAVQEDINSLGQNDEVIYASVWGTNPDGARAATPLGELRRGEAATLQPPNEVPRAVSTQRTAEWIFIDTPVLNPKGSVVGVSRVAFSLARENASIRVSERRVLGLAVASALVISIVLIGLARVLIMAPLAKLAVAAGRLEQGEQIEIAVGARDEIGELARAFEAMASAIQSREAQITARNRDMRRVLDNVESGLLTVDADGKMAEERSAILSTWFGESSERTLACYFERVAPQIAARIRFGWAAVFDGFFPTEVAIDQLPEGFDHAGRLFELRYRPVFEGELLSQVLVIVSDATPRVERERAELAQREMLSLFQRMVADHRGVEEFLAEASGLVDAITGGEEADDATLRRHVHTLKGNASLFGLERIAAACHDIESRMSDVGRPCASDKAQLRALWSEVLELMRCLGHRSGSAIQIDERDHEALLRDLSVRADHGALSARVRSWRYEAASKRLARLAEQIRALSRRLDRGAVVVECAPTELRLPPRAWAPFWSVMAHVVRNVVDHGTETPETRRRRGKAGPPTISLGIAAREHGVVVEVSDDGPGIDWARVADRAEARGLPRGTEAELEEALFADGVSTAEDVTDVSGRGVGMGAVRDAVTKLGGCVELESRQGAGTTLRFLLPLTMLTDDRPDEATLASARRADGVVVLSSGSLN